MITEHETLKNDEKMGKLNEIIERLIPVQIYSDDITNSRYNDPNYTGPHLNNEKLSLIEESFINELISYYSESCANENNSKAILPEIYASRIIDKFIEILSSENAFNDLTNSIIFSL